MGRTGTFYCWESFISSDDFGKVSIDGEVEVPSSCTSILFFLDPLVPAFAVVARLPYLGGFIGGLRALPWVAAPFFDFPSRGIVFREPFWLRTWPRLSAFFMEPLLRCLVAGWALIIHSGFTVALWPLSCNLGLKSKWSSSSSVEFSSDFLAILPAKVTLALLC